MYKLCAIGKRYIHCLLIDIICNVIAFVISLPFTILLLFLLTAHFIIKWVIVLVCGANKNSVFYGAGRKLLRNGELAWVEVRKQSIMQAVLVFDSKINVSTIRELIKTRVLPLYPRLTHRIFPLPYTANTVHCWVPDKHFNINKHVYSDITVKSEKQLQNYISQRIFEKFPVDIPPWELRVLSCHDGASISDTIIVVRIHKNLIDAMTLIKILCTKLADTRTTFTATKDHYKFNYYIRILQVCCIGPAIVLYRLLMSSINKFWLKIDKTRDCSIHWSTNICLCKLERIKQVTRSSYNCVMLSAVSGAFRSLLQKSAIKHPPDLKIVLPVMVNKNQMSVQVALNIPVSIEGAIPRLWKSKYELKMLCKSYDPFISFLISYILIPLCPSKFHSVLDKISKKSASVQFGCIVGPTSRLVIDGSPLKTMYSFLPTKHDTGISVSVITYANQVCVSAVTNSSLGDIGKFLIKYIEDQVEQMFILLMNRTIPEELSGDYFQNQLPDVSHVTSKELKSRMQIIQYEMQQINELISYSEDDVKHYTRLKSEFQHVFKEMKRRKSERLKRQNGSLFIRGIVQINKMCTLRRNKVILYSFPQHLKFNADSSSDAASVVTSFNPSVSVNSSSSFVNFDSLSQNNTMKRSIYNTFEMNNSIVDDVSCRNSYAISNDENNNIDNNNSDVVDGKYDKNNWSAVPILKCYDKYCIPNVSVTDLEEQTLFLKIRCDEHII